MFKVTDVRSKVWKVSEGCAAPQLSGFGREDLQERREAAAPGKFDEASHYQHEQAGVCWWEHTNTGRVCVPSLSAAYCAV